MLLPAHRRWRSFHFALALSMALHLLVLTLHVRMPPRVQLHPQRPLDVALAPPPSPAPSPLLQPSPPPEAPAEKPRPRPRPKPRPKPAPLAAPSAPRSLPVPEEPPPTAAERRFMEEPYPPEPVAQPPGGLALAQQALAAASGVAREQREAELFRARENARAHEDVDPLSMELYFEAFVKKLNRSAAFVRQQRSGRGRYIAVVEVSLNADGTLKSYKVINAGDQQAEIDYIRDIVERAAPFGAFPPEVRKHINSLSFDICILPRHLDSGGGGMFTRTYGGRDCHELG